MSAAPAIDEGDPSGLSVLWQSLVDPTPGRFSNTVRVVVLVLAVVAILETFRIAEIALAAFIVLFVSRAEKASTVMGALIAGIAVILAFMVAIGVFMFSLSEPALRLPLIAVVTFIAMFLARTTGALGPAFFVAGFIIGYAQTLGDETLGLALSPGTVSNTAQFTLPELVFFSPEEALVRFLLWFTLVVAIPIALVIIANLLTGRDPSTILTAALNERLLAAARFCEGQAGADRALARLAREDTAELLKLDHLSGVLHRSTHHPAPVREIHLLLLRLLALNRIADQDDRLIPVAQFCRDQASGRTEAPAPELTLPGIAQPLGRQITQTLQSIRKPPEHVAAKAPHGLLSPDAFTNPDHTRFALKVTLAVMFCYSLQDGLDWPGIHTIIITCYFVSLATVGETLHKATLRLVGCLIGGALGIGAILIVMPLMTDLGHLLLLLAPVTFLSGWIAFGSERIAYAGLQIALAFYLSTLQGFGPTLDMETARDRIVGLLIGNTVIFLIFVTIWPISTASVVRANLAKAVDVLAILFRADSAEQRAAFFRAIAQARSVMVNEPFETRSVLAADGRRQIDAGILASVQALFIPVSVLLDLRDDPAWQCVPDSTRTMLDAHQTALANWFQRAANWVRTGEGADDVAESLPEPPPSPSTQPQGDHASALAAWYHLLHQDILTILGHVGPHAQPATAAAPGELHLVAG